MKQKKHNILGYAAIVVAFAMVIGTATALIQMNSNAAAEAVTVAERATSVSSPFTQAVQSVKNSVVGVNNYAKISSQSYFYGFGRGFGDNVRPDSREDGREVVQGSGSGVVIAKGYVLTNYHVVEGATSLEVTTADKTYKATLAGYDQDIDIAVLKVDQLDLEPVVVGDSDLLEVGDWAICIGNPLSFTGTTTVGVVSALNREITNSKTDIYGRRTDSVNAMIQTDAAINAGNSGGGMFNIAGELVGIPSMKYTGSYYSNRTVEGIGMAVPINAVKPLINEVLSGKTIEEAASETGGGDQAIVAGNKPRIGVSVTNMNISNYAVATGILPTGAYVTDVESGSPAEKAGLKVGDIVVEVDGTVITSTTQMVNILQSKQVGQTATVKIYRVEGLDSIERYEDIPDGEYMDLTVELALLDNVKQ